MGGFTKIAETKDLQPGAAKLIEVAGRKIALFNVDGKFYALDDTCTHRGGPLSEGSIGRFRHLSLAWRHIRYENGASPRPSCFQGCRKL